MALHSTLFSALMIEENTGATCSLLFQLQWAAIQGKLRIFSSRNYWLFFKTISILSFILKAFCVLLVTFVMAFTHQFFLMWSLPMNRHITRKTEAWQQSTWSLPASKSCSWTATSSHRSHYINLLVIWNLATKWYISLCSDPRSPFALHLWRPCKKSHSGGKTVLNTNFHINTKRFIIYFKKINWFPLERDCKNPKEKG